MAPMAEGNDSLPAENKIISHQFNSHTIRPKFACEKVEYPPQFAALNGTWLIDFPGMFETRGPDIDIAIHLTLQKILREAKSAKIMVLIAATCLRSSDNHIIDLVKNELELMFQDP